MEGQEDPPLVPPQAAEEQELHQDPSHQGMQQQPFLGFGMDPNWGGFGQMGMQPWYVYSKAKAHVCACICLIERSLCVIFFDETGLLQTFFFFFT